MKFLEDGTYMIRFGKLYRVEFPKSFLDDCNKVEIPNWKAIPVTNAQKIRSMTDEELASFLNEVSTVFCACVMDKSPCESDDCPCWLEWLKQECET